MARKWKEVRGNVREDLVEKYQQESEIEEAAFEMTLAELRRAREFTQVELASVVGVTQAQVSRIERQTDLYLSTLAGYLSAMGGELVILGRFPDKSVRLNIGEMLEDDEKVPA